MNKIKIISVLIFVLSIILAFYSKHIAEENDNSLALLKVINEQKAFTQEMSKNIFYIYNNRHASTKQLDESIASFVENVDNREKVLENLGNKKIKKQIKKILKLWNNFYLLVQKFRDLSKMHDPYTNIILEQLMNDIYKANIDLLIAFNKLIVIHKAYFDKVKKKQKIIQITLYSLLFVLLIYLFTQLKELMLFIQKFLDTSTKIIQKSTVQGIKPIETEIKSKDVAQALHDFNFLIDKINKSIDYSAISIQKSIVSLEDIENNIEDLLELIATMEKNESFDKELIQKEDVLIESLDELTASVKKLQILQVNLSNFKK